jgi:hypothetical protein
MGTVKSKEAENIKIVAIEGFVNLSNSSKEEKYRGSLSLPLPGNVFPKQFESALFKDGIPLMEGDCIETQHKNQEAYFFLYDTTLGVKKNKTYLKMKEKQKVNITKAGKKLKIETAPNNGVLTEQSNVNELGDLDALFGFLAKVESKKVKDQIAKVKKDDKGKFADEVIKLKSAKAGFLSALTGFAGPFTVPAELANIFAQWVIQAEMAYALSCVYMATPPSESEFKNHLYVLIGGKEAFNDAIQEAKKSLKGGAKEKIKEGFNKTNAGEAFTAAKDQMRAVIKAKITKKIGEKALKSVLRFIPLAGAIFGASSDFTNAKSFGDTAKEFYKG